MFNKLFELITGENYIVNVNYDEEFVLFKRRLKIDSLNLNEKEVQHVKKLFERAKAYDAVGKVEESSMAIEEMMNFIDYKGIVFRCEHFVKDFLFMEYRHRKSLKDLYMVVEESMMKGDLSKASTAYQDFKMHLLHCVPGFSLKNLRYTLDGLPVSISQCLDFDNYMELIEISDFYSSREVDFLGKLYEEAKDYYNCGKIAQGDEVWGELTEIISQHSFYTLKTQ